MHRISSWQTAGELTMSLFEEAPLPLKSRCLLPQVEELTRLEPTDAFALYWSFAYERQEAFLSRLSGSPKPWSNDPVISAHRFTNVYRAADRVSQYLIHTVISQSQQSPEDTLFRILLFKLFNKIETWESIRDHFGEPKWATFSVRSYSNFLDSIMLKGVTIFSSAYIMPSRAGLYSSKKKHHNLLEVLDFIMRSNLSGRLATFTTLRQLYESLQSYPMLGSFLAYQYAIDINYSDLVDFPESEFVVAGPGALSGIAKSFGKLRDTNSADIIRLVTDLQDLCFEFYDLRFRKLCSRSLQLIDCQNIFCELDKYARVALPQSAGRGGRTRIKHKLGPACRPITFEAPPKWLRQLETTEL